MRAIVGTAASPMTVTTGRAAVTTTAVVMTTMRRQPAAPHGEVRRDRPLSPSAALDIGLDRNDGSSVPPVTPPGTGAVSFAIATHC